MKQKTFFIVFQDLSLKQIKSTLLENESPTSKGCDRNWKMPGSTLTWHLEAQPRNEAPGDIRVEA